MSNGVPVRMPMAPVPVPLAGAAAVTTDMGTHLAGDMRLHQESLHGVATAQQRDNTSDQSHAHDASTLHCLTQMLQTCTYTQGYIRQCEILEFGAAVIESLASNNVHTRPENDGGKYWRDGV
jgi:hypothetical protein